MGGWETQLASFEPEKMNSRIEKVLMGMGFSKEDIDRPVGEFSGGWQMRQLWVSFFFRDHPAHFRRTDQPPGCGFPELVGHYLKGYQGSILVISHDRAF